MPISAGLKDRLASNVTFVCPIWKIIAADGAVAAYCGHTRPLTFNSQNYVVSSVEATRPLQRIGLRPNTIEILGIFDDTITREELELGRWQGAKIVFEWVDYLNLGLGSTGRVEGFIGKITVVNPVTYRIEMLSKSDAVQPLLGDLTSPLDRNTFPAGIDIGDFTFTGLVKQVTSKMQFKVDYVQPSSNYFRYGLVRFTSGENSGREMEIKTSTATDSNTRTELFLQLPLNSLPVINDNVELVAGYDGTREQMRERFDDMIDSNSEPDLPGLKSILRYPE